MFYEPGLPADLTRCALLISNIYNPQLDHRPYYTCLEDLAASAALEAVNRLSTHSTHGRVAVKTDGAYALDPSNPQHLLYAITAINHVLFTCEGLSVNTVDSHDPLNGSLADVMDRKLGEPLLSTAQTCHSITGLWRGCISCLVLSATPLCHVTVTLLCKL